MLFRGVTICAHIIEGTYIEQYNLCTFFDHEKHSRDHRSNFVNHRIKIGHSLKLHQNCAIISMKSWTQVKTSLIS